MACSAGGQAVRFTPGEQGFDSPTRYSFRRRPMAGRLVVTQVIKFHGGCRSEVERPVVAREVAGSFPVSHPSASWTSDRPAASKAVAFGHTRFESWDAHVALVAQRIEHRPPTAGVTGSSPVEGAHDDVAEW